MRIISIFALTLIFLSACSITTVEDNGDKKNQGPAEPIATGPDIVPIPGTFLEEFKEVAPQKIPPEKLKTPSGLKIGSASVKPLDVGTKPGNIIEVRFLVTLRDIKLDKKVLGKKIKKHWHEKQFKGTAEVKFEYNYSTGVFKYWLDKLRWTPVKEGSFEDQMIASALDSYEGKAKKEAAKKTKPFTIPRKTIKFGKMSLTIGLKDIFTGSKGIYFKIDVNGKGMPKFDLKNFNLASLKDLKGTKIPIPDAVINQFLKLSIAKNLKKVPDLKGFSVRKFDVKFPKENTMTMEFDGKAKGKTLKAKVTITASYDKSSRKLNFGGVVIDEAKLGGKDYKSKLKKYVDKYAKAATVTLPQIPVIKQKISKRSLIVEVKDLDFGIKPNAPYIKADVKVHVK